MVTPNKPLDSVWLEGWKREKMERVGRMEKMKDEEDYNNSLNYLIKEREL